MLCLSYQLFIYNLLKEEKSKQFYVDRRFLVQNNVVQFLKRVSFSRRLVPFKQLIFKTIEQHDEVRGHLLYKVLLDKIFL